jgi:hypothetical protein
VRFLIASGLMLICSACADLSAVQNFSKMAPDPSAIQGLTKAYAQELDVREDVKLLGDNAPNPQLADEDNTRAQQAVAIQGLDTSIREYMQALGTLAGNDIVQSSSNVKDVTTGLTSLQKDVPSLKLTTEQITVIGQFVQSIADLAENGYRNAKLVEIIKTQDGPFQELIVIQTDIVSKAIRPSIAEIQRSLDEQVKVSDFVNQDIKDWTIAVSAAATKAGRSDDSPGYYLKRNPTYGVAGASDAHVARYLFKKSIESDRTSLSAQLAAADAYVKALHSIGLAHTELLKKGNDLLTKATVTQIQPLARDVYKDYQDIQSLESSGIKH